MNNLLTNTLYKSNRVLYRNLSIRAREFNGAYNGNNIMQDNIFRIMENYARRQEMKLETMFLPIRDDDFCAFSCLRKGIIFIVINSWLPLCKQIFAAAHELYHIWCYFNERESSLLSEGSLLTADDFENVMCDEEDLEANAFAGMILVPTGALNEQIDIYGIDRKNIKMGDILMLMDIFAMPYKAMVIRLYEEEILNDRKAQEYLEVPTCDVLKYMLLFDKARRWQRRTPDNISTGRLQGLIESNAEKDVLPESRILEDRARVREIVNEFVGK